MGWGEGLKKGAPHKILRGGPADFRYATEYKSKK